MSHKCSRIPVTYWLFFIVMMMAGAVVALGWSKREFLFVAFESAIEQRDMMMSGDAGPVTYLVYHDDYTILEQASYSDDDILGVELYKLPDIAAIAFTAPGVDSIQRVKQLPGVRRMLRKDVPMLCH